MEPASAGTFHSAVSTMRLITANLNGIRSAASKGFFDWLKHQKADAVGVQEVKAQADVVEGKFDACGRLHGHFHYAQKKGYSGVGLYTHEEPSDLRIGFGSTEFDAEGRWVEKRFDKPGRKLSLISCYFPSGSSGEERQAAKFRFLAEMAPHLAALKAEREFILVGDVNIAHKEIDLKNWKGNLKNSGFLPEERAWLDALFGAAGLVDVFRTLNPQATVLDELLRHKEMPISEARNYLARYLFRGDDVFSQISTLSGGERARLARPDRHSRLGGAGQEGKDPSGAALQRPCAAARRLRLQLVSPARVRYSLTCLV